ncbi:NodT family efflux transporter outer membrane factor (OMF) lipoprotein [Endobacter medicaginis]|uniref:Efflux transporter outer membrane subunit n=1 Tax=Endobacter medicaginis TaxID=1181271 RepID=A0A839UZK0_9PROT|nr:efflux transporter outer membrane subunit [Endobacter medicaginis]MBB3175327.1 NodT family efflux transporter outer membrane factor (OMF) lipoprotein [Endobacter medicaginis]MCX5477227.1 efflux transporter outer membrane subunit [Endobacter medicaginis]NVN30499.1 efflux transporter outer membrane subunit [Endobacter medicaginis]
MMHLPRLAVAALLSAATMLSGCDLAPDYHPPGFILPADWAGSGPFTRAHPADALPRGPWWRMFDDPVLDGLESRAVAGNPDLAATAEAYTQARDLAAEARAGLFPQITATASTSDNRRSDHALFRSSTGIRTMSSNEWGGTASWAPDFFSRIRNRTRAQKQLAQAAAADLASARLALEVELAHDYFALRGLDAQIAVYRQSIRYYETAVQITQLRLGAKIAAALDVERAKTQLAQAQALLTDTEASRELMAHAIAVRCGADASTFAIAPIAMPSEPGTHPATEARATDGAMLPDPIPAVPASVPSLLLQRRPDIAQAEREMAAANTSIGVSRAAFYPDVTISLTGGFMDSGWNLGNIANSLWSVGAGAMLPLFQGGLRRAELQRSWSQYAQTRDQYRARVLDAFREVEDGLTLTRKLATEHAQQTDAVTAALHTQTMTLQLYTGGLTNYLDAVVAQEAALTARIAAVQVRTRQLQASVSLIGALGGGWSAAALPGEDATLPFHPLDPDFRK